MGIYLYQEMGVHPHQVIKSKNKLIKLVSVIISILQKIIITPLEVNLMIQQVNLIDLIINFFLLF